MKTSFICLAIAVALCVSQSDAQWVQKGLADRPIAKIAVGSSGWFAITSDSGNVFRSTNNGLNWLEVLDDSLGSPGGILLWVLRGWSLLQ